MSPDTLPVALSSVVAQRLSDCRDAMVGVNLSPAWDNLLPDWQALLERLALASEYAIATL